MGAAAKPDIVPPGVYKSSCLLLRRARRTGILKTGVLIIVLACQPFYGCKKIVHDKMEQMAIQLIITGQWQVEDYSEGPVSITYLFEGYHFRFRENGTVSGYKGAQETSGTWKADLLDYSITSEFPSAGDPLKKLNGTWKIKDSGADFVKAELSDTGTTSFLQLRRN